MTIDPAREVVEIGRTVNASVRHLTFTLGAGQHRLTYHCGPTSTPIAFSVEEPTTFTITVPPDVFIDMEDAAHPQQEDAPCTAPRITDNRSAG